MEDSPTTLTLMRGQVPVTSFLGSLGGTLRETRITAMLGYLIAHDPKHWCKFFALDKPISSVKIEANYDKDRADIVIETTKERVVVEAKVSWRDPRGQVEKYQGDKKFLFTDFLPASTKSSRKLRYVSWQEIKQVLDRLAKETAKPYVRHLVKELLAYMGEHQMIRNEDSVEIYARELNDELTVNTFLKANIYGCWLEAGGGKISRALYFAPHFGQYIANRHPGIHRGISYLAKIDAVEVVDTWPSFLRAAKRVRGGWWLNRHNDLLLQLRRRWKNWDEKHRRNIAFLGTPRLVFNPPVNKDLLQKGKGWLSRRTFSFDKLFEAWGKSSSAKIR